MNAEKVTRTGERRKREREADSCFACGHPERLVCWEAWQIKLRTDSLDAERRGTSYREKGKAENFSAVSASAVATSSIIPLIIINYYQRTRGPFTSSSERQRGDSYTHRVAAACLCVSVCVWVSFLCLPRVLSLFPTDLVWAVTSLECGIFGFFVFDCLCNAQVSQGFFCCSLLKGQVIMAEMAQQWIGFELIWADMQYKYPFYCCHCHDYRSVFWFWFLFTLFLFTFILILI